MAMQFSWPNLAGEGTRPGRPPQPPGAVATEIALVLPVVLLLVMAAADFGRVAHYDQVVSNAARAGGETGALRQFTPFTRPAWEAAVRQAALSEMQSLPGFDEAQLDYSLSTQLDADGLAQIVVEVAYPFQTRVAWPGIPSLTQLRQRYEIRQYR